MRKSYSVKLASLETLFETKRGRLLPLPPRLARLYGCLRMPVFASRKVRVLIVTTIRGAKHLCKQKVPDSVEIRAIRHRAGANHQSASLIAASDVLDAVGQTRPGGSILVEGGPRLLGDFYAEDLLDEQFLTLAPQIAGREANDRRLSLAMGTAFAPGDARWGTLTDARRGGSHLFLRYGFSKRTKTRRDIEH